jgi:ketosteroid isomerase-like protein
MASSLQDAVDAFYRAANQNLSGDTAGLHSIWSDADDISDMGPTGAMRRGRKAVIEQFATESVMGFDGTVEMVDRTIVETADMGYVVCREQAPGATLNGQPIALDLRSTTIFRRENGHWRLVHHHTDRF